MDTLQFLLFLYIQQLNRVSLRTSLIGEEWPSHRTRSPSPSEAKTSSQNKVLYCEGPKKNQPDDVSACLNSYHQAVISQVFNVSLTARLYSYFDQQNWDDQAHLSFVQSHLGEILELLMEPGQLSQSGQSQRDFQVSSEVAHIFSQRAKRITSSKEPAENRHVNLLLSLVSQQL